MCSNQRYIIFMVAVLLLCSVLCTESNQPLEDVNDKNKGNIFVDSSSPYCRSSEGQKLVCDYNSTTKPIYLEVPSRHKRNVESSLYKSVEIRSASVFHLAESACLEDISILDTKRVIVDDSYQKKRETENCAEYQLSLINSTITSIPVTVTRLNVVRSTIEKLVTPPPLARALVLQSKVGVFSTRLPLNGSSVVNISYTNIGQVHELRMRDRAKILILSSNLTFTNTEPLHFQDNVSVIISKSSLSPQQIELRIDPDVEVTLDEVKGKVIIKVLRLYDECDLSESKADRISADELFQTNNSEGNITYLYIILAVAGSIVLTLLSLKLWNWIQQKKSKSNEGQGQVTQRQSANGKRLSSCSSDSGIDKDEVRVPIMPSKTPETSPYTNQSEGSSLKKRQPAAKKQLSFWQC